MLLEELLENYSPANHSRTVCRLCLGSTPKPIKPCPCPFSAIHENCLKIIISQNLIYKDQTITVCEECLTPIRYKLTSVYRCRTYPEVLKFLGENVAIPIIMVLVVLLALEMNENVIEKIEATTFWMKVLRGYLIAVGFYLQVVIGGVVLIIIAEFFDEFYVRNYEPSNIELLLDGYS